MFNSITTTPRLVIHGGAGNITRSNLPPSSYAAYARALLDVTSSTSKSLAHGASALSAATHAVAALEDFPLFNYGKGAVFTRDGTIELEAPVRWFKAFVCWRELFMNFCIIGI